MRNDGGEKKNERERTINEIALGCTERVNGVHLFRLHNMITLLIEKPPAIHIRFYPMQIVYRRPNTHLFHRAHCTHTILMEEHFFSLANLLSL